jgi:photosystem II stability/assembly factor-like uncharacterized protein
MRRSRIAVAAALVLAAALTLPAAATNRPAPPAKAPTSAWVPTLPTSQQSRQFLTAFPEGTAYVFDVGNAITLWHSDTAGLAWDALTYLPAGVSSFAQARFATPDTGYMADFNRLLVTTDGARTATSWKELSGPRLPKGYMYVANALGVTGSTVSFGADLHAPLHVGCNPPQSSHIWTSHDKGRTWVDARLPDQTLVSQVRFVTPRDGVALAYEMKPDGNPCEMMGSTNSVYVTHDGGRSFTNVHKCAVRSGEICTAAAFVDSRRLMVGRNDGSLAISTDGGRVFREQPALATIAGAQPTGTTYDEAFWVQGFASVGDTVYATTKLAGTYVSRDAGASWTRETSCDTGFSLGIGEVALFDANRAIAGGPTCVATRVTGPGAASTAPVPASVGTGLDWIGSAGGRTVSVRGGRVTLRW